ncbi:hypothetical protein [Bosea sp. 117]|uniref:pyroglutamyl-peptidase I family protein n=1 Tax=Bosea sp. 117 TaxID=1125973 RepID=UPI00068BE858|nr:hypothetical protein [Bosea sp. 117]
MPAPRVLITGFGRFPGVPVNPSAALAQALSRSRRPGLTGLDRRVLVLPTTWEAAAGFDAVLAQEQPDIVLMIGLAARRTRICVETLAVNRARPFPDAARRRPATHRLDPSGAAAVRAGASAPPLLHALRLARLPMRASRDAGGYICNALAYRAYGRVGTPGGPRLAVFVHIPRPSPRLPLSAMRRGLEALLVALAAQLRG